MALEPTAGPAFVGRSSELLALGRILDEVSAGRPRSVLVRGPAGIGKTALVRHFAASHPGLRVVWTAGQEIESLLPFGVAEQLLAAAGQLAQPLEQPLDHLALGADLVDAVARLAATSPVLVVVDDTQWVDGPSLAALTFTLRRLGADPVLTVLVMRDEEGSAPLPVLQRALDEGELGQLTLGGLGETDIVALARQAGVPDLSVAAARRLVAHTGGSPLHAQALLEELDVEILTDATGAPLPAPATFSLLVLGRLAHCGPAAQELVAAAAVLGMRWRLGAAAAVSGLQDHGPAIDDAVTAGLIERGARRDELRFPHPLVRAAVYHDLAPGRRAALHARAAEVVEDPGLRLRHRGDACLGPDPALATETAAYAATQAARGSWSAAAAAFLDAARLGPGPAAGPRLLSAVECLILAGDTPAALALQQDVEACPDSAQRHYVQGFIAAVSGDRLGAARLLGRAWEVMGSGDRELAGKVASQLAMMALNEGRGPDAMEWAGRALAARPQAPDRGIARAVQGFAFGEVGRFDEGISLMGDPPAHPAEFDAGSLGSLLGRGVLRMWSGDIAGAVADLTTAHESARRLGPLYLRIIVLFYLAEAEYRLGRWDDATVHAELATSLGHDGGDTWTLGLAHAVAVFPTAGRGEWARAQAHLEAATAVATVLGDPANQMWVGTARARLAHARSDHREVVAATDAVARLDMAHGRDQPGIQPWALLRSEALVALGQIDEAQTIIDGVAERARPQHETGVLAGVERARALVAAARGDLDAARDAFDAAGVLARDAAMPQLDRALLEVDRGSFMRRRGRRRVAAELLQAAHRRLVDLGALPYLERCERELAACGLHPRTRADAPHVRLSPQELAVATLAGRGRSNRDIAAELVVSVKTVEYHLGNVYTKLGVRGRAELAARLGAGATIPA